MRARDKIIVLADTGLVQALLGWSLIACSGADATPMRLGSNEHVAGAASLPTVTPVASVPQQAPSSGGSISPPPAAKAGASSVAMLGTDLAPADPSITFNWTEASATKRECQPGHYVGVFTCVYNKPPDVEGVEVAGPVEFVLEKSQNGEFLEIAQGQLNGAAYLLFGFRADLAGRLDCGTRKLEGHAVNGVWGLGDPDVFMGGTFEGTLGGMYDGANGTLDGDWFMTVAEPLGGTCEGPWSASYTP